MEDSQSHANAIAVSTESNFLPLYFYELTPKLRNQAKIELSEDADFPEKHVAEFRNLIGGSTDLAYSNEDLMIFLRAAKHDVHRAYDTFKKHNAIFTKYDALFQNFHFHSIYKPIETNSINFLPRRDADNCIVAVCFLQKWEVSNFTFADIIRVCVIAMLDALRCTVTQITGLKIIVDFSGLTINKMMSFPPWILKFTADALQKTLPMRLKEYHVVNNGKFFGYIWAVFRPLLSKKLRQRGELPRYAEASLDFIENKLEN